MTALHIKPGYRMVYLGLLLGLCLILSYVENLIPLNFSIPGIKLGLSNFPVLICLYILNPVDALVLSISKALLSSLLFGSMFSLFYSLFGAILSCLVMIFLYKAGKFTAISISSAGGVFHNVAQFFIALVVLESKGLWYYFPFLILAGFVCGILLGMVAYFCIPYIKRIVLR